MHKVGQGLILGTRCHSESWRRGAFPAVYLHLLHRRFVLDRREAKICQQVPPCLPLPYQQFASVGEVGKAISVYSRVFRLIGCDAYTRTFYEAPDFRGWVWGLLFSLTTVLNVGPWPSSLSAARNPPSHPHHFLVAVLRSGCLR